MQLGNALHIDTKSTIDEYLSALLTRHVMNLSKSDFNNFFLLNRNCEVKFGDGHH